MAERLGHEKHARTSGAWRGLTTGEVEANFYDIYGAQVSKDTTSRIADKAIEEMTEWANRPLELVSPVVFVDALVLRGGQVRNKPFSPSALP